MTTIINVMSHALCLYVISARVCSYFADNRSINLVDAIDAAQDPDYMCHVLSHLQNLI